MITSDTRKQIHKLIDEADEHQLNAVLDVLNPSNSRYTQEEINSFYNRVKLFEEGLSKGSSVADAHTNIRNKFKERHGA